MSTWCWWRCGALDLLWLRQTARIEERTAPGRTDCADRLSRGCAEAIDLGLTGNAMQTMDFEQARFNMVEQQVRPWDVLDQSVLDLLFVVKREDFVPPEYRALAFSDM